jgi:hypothetical protein
MKRMMISCLFLIGACVDQGPLTTDPVELTNVGGTGEVDPLLVGAEAVFDDQSAPGPWNGQACDGVGCQDCSTCCGELMLECFELMYPREYCKALSRDCVSSCFSVCPI